MAVRTLLPKSEFGFIIRRDITYAEEDVGMKREIASFDDVGIALEAWPSIVERYPKDRLTLRNGARVIREHNPTAEGGP